jgi:hypothetical protein
LEETEFAYQINKALLAHKKKLQLKKMREMKMRGKFRKTQENETECRKKLLWLCELLMLLCWYVSGCGSEDNYGQVVENVADDGEQDKITEKAGEEDRKVEKAEEVLVDFSAFTSTTLSNCFILVTFGIMCPLLAVTLSVTIYTSALHLQYVVGSAIRQSRLGSDDHHKKIIHQLEKDCNGDIFERSIYQVRFVLVSLSALFMSAFLFDMTSNKPNFSIASG